MKIFNLVLAILKNFEMIRLEKNKSKHFYFFMALITALIIFIPLSILIGYISYLLTSIYENERGASIIFSFLAIFCLIFSFNVIKNIFYSSKDTINLLSLPLKNEEIALAKFFVALINESFIEGIIVVSASIGYLIGIKASIFSYLMIIIFMLSFTIIPLAVASIITMVYMYIIRNIKNKKIINYLFYFIQVIIILIFIVIARSSFINKAFFQNYLMLKAFINPIYLIFYLGINIISIIFVYLVAKKLYFKGLSFNFNNKIKSKSIKYNSYSINQALIIRELKLIFKTPAYFSSLIIINFIWIAFTILLLLFNRLNVEIIKNNLISIILTISLIIPASNSIASSAISREGEGIYYIMTLPIELKKIIKAKKIVGIIISEIFTIIISTIIFVFLNISFINSLIFIIIGLMGVIINSNLGILIDLKNPKLVWDSEINALRGNIGVFINMSIAILMSIIFILINFLFYKLSINNLLINLIIMMLVALILVLSYFLLNKKVIKYFKKL